MVCDGQIFGNVKSNRVILRHRACIIGDLTAESMSLSEKVRWPSPGMTTAANFRVQVTISGDVVVQPGIISEKDAMSATERTPRIPSARGTSRGSHRSPQP